MSKWGSIACSVWVIACAAVTMFGIHTCGSPTPGRSTACEAGVFELDRVGVGSPECRGARVTIEERAGKRYAVCTCDLPAVAPDAGTDAAVER